MIHVSSQPEDEVRHAIEILAAADDRIIEKQVRAVRGHGVRFLDKVRAVEDIVTLRDLENALAGLRSVVDPATARAAQATENVWREVADTYGLLKSGEVGELLGASKNNREFVASRRSRGELLGVVRNNGYLFPGFQFDRSAGAIRSWVKPLLVLAAESNQGAADVLFWMMSPTTYFDGDRPADHVDDADRLVDVARRSWSVEW
jgi:hypothetical protein